MAEPSGAAAPRPAARNGEAEGAAEPAEPATAETLVMGVLNVTPDSFSDGGTFIEPEAAIAHGLELARQGADIIDVGGESTRPGASPVARGDELSRVLPVVRALSAAGLAVSIDTLHAETAQSAVAAGARFINDVSGGLHDPGMYEAAAWASAEHGASLILCHWRGVPDPGHGRSDYADVVAEVRDALAARAQDAIRAGVDPRRIIVDPGLGFDKTGEQCWSLLANLGELRALGYPVLVGTSRKRMIADALAAAGLQSAPVQRDLATSVTSALAARSGVWGVRVHDVAGTVQALAVARQYTAGAQGASADSAPTAPQAERSGAALRHAGADDGSRPPAPGGPAGAEDRISLTGLEVFAHHGVFDFERERGQRFLIDAELAVDLSPAAAGDALERTVHYGELAEAVVAAVERDPVDLIETVAERVAGVALGFAGVREARITVHKPDAPIDAEFADVSVTVVRRPGSAGGAPAGPAGPAAAGAAGRTGDHAGEGANR